MLCLKISDTANVTVKGVDYCYIIHDIRKSETIHLLENSVLEDRSCIYIKMHINEINIKNQVCNCNLIIQFKQRNSNLKYFN